MAMPGARRRIAMQYLDAVSAGDGRVPAPPWRGGMDLRLEVYPPNRAVARRGGPQPQGSRFPLVFWGSVRVREVYGRRGDSPTRR